MNSQIENQNKPVYCPNCMPDYINGFLKHKPVLNPVDTGNRHCFKCGIGFNDKLPEFIPYWIKLASGVSGVGHDNMALAVYLADMGYASILEFEQLIASWTGYIKDEALAVLGLSVLASTGSWRYALPDEHPLALGNVPVIKEVKL